MRLLVTVLTYMGSLAVVALAALGAAIVLGGPHAGLLPRPLEVLFFGLGWLAVLLLPVLAARAVWRLFGRGTTALQAEAVPADAPPRKREGPPRSA